MVITNLLNKTLPPQPIDEQKPKVTERKYAKHYVMAYIFDCHVKGERPPQGEKKKLERIGVEKMGKGRGNTFYKNFNKIINQDLNCVRILVDIGGENWREIILELSSDREQLEKYLQSKGL